MKREGGAAWKPPRARHIQAECADGERAPCWTNRPGGGYLVLIVPENDLAGECDATSCSVCYHSRMKHHLPAGSRTSQHNQWHRIRYAYHEAGHAVVGHVIGRCISEVSIVAEKDRG